MAPLIKALANKPWAQVTTLATAQHRNLLDQVLALFDITPDADLDIMRNNQTLSELTARLTTGLDQRLRELQPDAVLAQGDTTTVMVAALVAFYLRIPFGHVEAGLRTHDKSNPFPEETNRVIAGHLARWHFAPTARSRQNLLREGIDAQAIHVTGNTVIDALLATASREHTLDVPLDANKRLVLLTAHRRENFGARFHSICVAVRTLADRHDDIEFLYPVHPNPNVHDVAHTLLADHPRIHLVPPLDYAPFVEAQKRAYLIITDSGGVQEEAPALGKPVLVLRDETERPEAIDEGVVELVGTDSDHIVSAATRVLDDEQAYRQLAKGVSPYGDGKAAQRIVAVLENDLAGATPHAQDLTDRREARQ